MADEEVSFVKLNENNYITWKVGLNVVLRSVELSGYVDGSEKQPNKAEKPAEWKAWNKNSLKAMDIIIGSVEQRLHRYLIHCTSAKEAWNELKQRFGEPNEDLVNLWGEFYDFRMKDGVDIANQINDFRGIIEKLEYVGEKPSDAAIQAKVLNILPERFSQLRMIWDCVPQTKRTTDSMLNWIIREDKRLRDFEENAKLLERKIIEIGLKKSEDQSPERKKNKKNIEDLKLRTKCSICKEKGHWARECANKKNEENQVIASVSGIFPKTADSDADAWLADTSASMHMTFRRDFFTSFEALSESRFVKVADNRFLEVVGKGTLTLTEKIGEKVIESKMENVLLVPELKKNLFSISTLIDKNFSFYASKSHCEVRCPEGTLICRGVKQNRGIFKMHFKVKPPTVHTTGIAIAQWK